MGNRGKIEQVIMNLLSNAKDALRKKSGTISIETFNFGQNIIVEITDNGNGIAKEDFYKIFESFYTTKPVGKGTGLGLSITHSIIKNHKGNIYVKSSSPQGSCITFELPVTCMHDKLSDSTNGELIDTDLKKSKGMALIVDDEEDIREILNNYLTQSGLTVHEASNGKEALEMMTKENYNYILTDIKMPKMNGKELIAKASKLIMPSTKLYIITGSISSTETDELPSSPLIKGVITKPFSKKDIINIL